MSEKIKIECGQVWRHEASGKYRMILATLQNHVEISSNKVSYKVIEEYYTLYRHADGTLAEPEQVDTGSDSGLSERELWLMDEAFIAGGYYADNDSVGLADWLEDVWYTIHTTRYLVKNAPPPEPNHSKQDDPQALTAAYMAGYRNAEMKYRKQVEVLAERMAVLYDAANYPRTYLAWFDSDGKAIIPDAEVEYCECTAGRVFALSSNLFKFCPYCGKQIKEVSDE